MTDYAPGPWDCLQLSSGTYRLEASQGPLRVCPAIAHSLADARLIQAAPEMLEALQEVTRMLSDIGRGDRIIAAIRNARQIIAKAKGE